MSAAATHLPEVADVVLYHPAPDGDRELASGHDQPLAAIVTHVWSDWCVNLMVLDADGATYPRRNVEFWHHEVPAPDSERYAYYRIEPPYVSPYSGTALRAAR